MGVHESVKMPKCSSLTFPGLGVTQASGVHVEALGSWMHGYTHDDNEQVICPQKPEQVRPMF